MKKFLGIFALLFLLSIGLVTASAVTINYPAANAQLAGVDQASGAYANVTVNAAFITENGNFEPECSATLIATGSYPSANTTIALASTKFTNETEFDYIVNLSHLAAFEDGKYSLVIYCGNATVGSTNTTSSEINVYVDNSKPQTPTAMTPATGSESFTRTQTFTSTVEGNDTTMCVLSFADSALRPGTGIYYFAPNGNTCSKTISISGGQYTFKMGASDETNTTYNAVQTLTMSSSHSGGVSYTPTDGDGMNIVFIVLVGVAAFLLLKEKK